MIEHRLKELFRIADRVIVMNYGEKIAEGAAKDVMESEAVKNAYLGTRSGLVLRKGTQCLKFNNLMVFFENALALNGLEPGGTGKGRSSGSSAPTAPGKPH